MNANRLRIGFTVVALLAINGGLSGLGYHGWYGTGGALATSAQEKVQARNSLNQVTVEYAYWPARTRIKAGTTVTFTNVGDIPHTATAFDKGKVGNWDTGPLNKGEAKAITFSEPGTYFYICTPHP